MEEKDGKSPAAAAKKNVMIPKDRNAPKKPITAYNLYAVDQRVKMKKENPDRSFGEMNREIGSLWAALSQEKKQPYIDRAEEGREKYAKEFEKYQKSEKYKQYLRTVAALQQRQQQKKVEKEQSKKKTSTSSKPLKDVSPAPSATDPPSLLPPSRPPPLSLKQSFVAGTQIPIFTDQFLLHNRELEVQVRKLRQATMDQEEENALLSLHVDNMRLQITRLEGEIQNQTLQNHILKQRLVFLQESLTDAFSGASVPGIDSVPSVESIDEYLKQVEGVVSDVNDEHSDVVSMVRGVAKELLERVRERGESTQEESMDNS